MKLYAWQSTGYGDPSFFVVAKDEVAARQAVEEHIRDRMGGRCEYWGTDRYVLTVADAGEVVTCDND